MGTALGSTNSRATRIVSTITQHAKKRNVPHCNAQRPAVSQPLMLAHVFALRFEFPAKHIKRVAALLFLSAYHVVDIVCGGSQNTTLAFLHNMYLSHCKALQNV